MQPCHCSQGPILHSPSITPTPLILPPWGLVCVSSTEQRKPKTRGILLKGVSKQPDINNLHVYRAESKPLGICGFSRVCVRVCDSVCSSIYLMRGAYICMYHVSQSWCLMWTASVNPKPAFLYDNSTLGSAHDWVAPLLFSTLNLTPTPPPTPRVNCSAGKLYYQCH